MFRSRIAPLLVLGLLASACSHENPVLPTDPGGGSGVEQFTVTVTSDLSQLLAGTAPGTTLRIEARHADGTPPADGTEVAVNTNLGSFGSDTAGKPILLAKTTLVAGKATVQFFAGSETGVANIMAQIGTNVGRLNLPIVAPPAPPVADFTFSANGLNVLFTDASTGSPASYRWQFGDGAAESTEKNPVHSYNAAGSYAVTLAVTNAGGQSSKSQFVTVSLGAAPVAAFELQVAGQQVNFVDRSTGSPTSWQWTFGDGGSSTLRNPIHTYASPGTYTASLAVSNAAGSNSTSQVVSIPTGAPPQAAFDFQAAGLQVNFVDRSTGNPTSWSWTFGDGESSTQRNPIHTYTAAGNYTVALTATNAAGSSNVSQIVMLTGGTPPAAKFAFSVNGMQVNFVDQSTGNPAAWSWDFGDSTPGSTQRNPIHTYAAAGNYTVTLTVSNTGGSNSASQVVTIAQGAPPAAAFTFAVNGMQVNFVDQSTGSPTTWQWNFGDSGSSSQQNPVHTYAAPGSYTVTLTVTSSAGSNSTSQVVTIGAPSPPAANFDFLVSGQQVNFLDRSTGNPTSWQWNFGDGTPVSTQQNPVHTYATPGSYTVVLTATNASGSGNASKVVKVP